MERSLASLLVTGGAGFIGSAFVRYLLRETEFRGTITTLDKLTYAGSLENLDGFLDHPRHRFVQADICDERVVQAVCEERGIDAIVHFAAETHVDRSIASAEPFVLANVVGTMRLLEVVRRLPGVHFHHISTDEVYGSLGESGAFSELSPYRPNSPYAASKAASDHFVRAYANTYGISTTVSHCSNNYGPGQHPEKFIPRMIGCALEGLPLPVYGRGANVRDWLYIDDHADAIWTILQRGKRGQTYDVGGGTELTNLELLKRLLPLVAQEGGRELEPLQTLITYVVDRPGHDFRYSIEGEKMRRELQWQPKISLDTGLLRTVRWEVGRRTPYRR